MSEHFVPPHLLQSMCDALVIDEGRRADANETAIVAGSLTAAAIAVVGTIYPGLVARQLASAQPGIDAGDDAFTWHRFDEMGYADFISNFADDLPSIEQYVLEMGGSVKSIGTSFSYSTQDLRRVIAARKNGRQAVVLDPNKMRLADMFIERKKDVIFAQGDTTRGLPGILTNSNITPIDAAVPATGTSRSWLGADKLGYEILKDLRRGCDTVHNQSKGNFKVNKIAMPINHFRHIASTPVLPSNENQKTILQLFLEGENAAGNPGIQVYAWNECLTADAGDPRIMFGQFDSTTLTLVDPMGMTAQAPQPKNLAWSVPVEARIGGALMKMPLAFCYMDQA